jgi:hypothetical protein
MGFCLLFLGFFCDVWLLRYPKIAVLMISKDSNERDFEFEFVFYWEDTVDPYPHSEVSSAVVLLLHPLIVGSLHSDHE